MLLYSCARLYRTGLQGLRRLALCLDSCKFSQPELLFISQELGSNKAQSLREPCGVEACDKM